MLQAEKAEALIRELRQQNAKGEEYFEREKEELQSQLVRHRITAVETSSWHDLMTIFVVITIMVHYVGHVYRHLIACRSVANRVRCRMWRRRRGRS